MLAQNDLLQFAFHRRICKTKQYYENTLYLTTCSHSGNCTQITKLTRQLLQN